MAGNYLECTARRASLPRKNHVDRRLLFLMVAPLQRGQQLGVQARN